MSQKNKVAIQPYLGCANDNSLYCYGRIIKVPRINTHNHSSKWVNFLNSLKRLESDELPYQTFELVIQDYRKIYQTNSEGFFRIEEKIADKVLSEVINEINYQLHNIPEAYEAEQLVVPCSIIKPKSSAQFGVISDIDDTILKTDVLSRFKLRLLYNSLFVHAHKRQVIAHTPDWYNILHQDINPFFYISNSPWNFYDYLMSFLEKNNFPMGPIFLRDFGKKKKDALQDNDNHKLNEIQKILQLYPHLPFVLIGDGGEKDADIYLQIKKQYSSQIKAIFIHRLGSATHQSRIEQLSKGHEAYFFFVESTMEAQEISKQLQLI